MSSDANNGLQPAVGRLWHQSDGTLTWLTRFLQKGLTRVYAVDLCEGLDLTHRELLDVAFDDIDGILEQANALGRQANAIHLCCARDGTNVLVLMDHDPHHQWILPAIENHLRDALAKIGWELYPSQIQSPDLLEGETLHFLGYSFRLIPGKHGTPRVQYREIESEVWTDATEPLTVGMLQRLRLRWTLPRWRLAQLDWNRLNPCPWGLTLRDAFRYVASIQASWQYLPITLYPAFVLIAGWNSPVAWVCLALILLFNWRSVPGLASYTLRHCLHVTMAALGIAFLVSVYLVAAEVYGNLSREVAAPYMPAGFFVGRYHPSWGAEPVSYGLYLPPHFQGMEGPFPLLVFLHGYGERTIDRLFSAGVPQAIVAQFGEGTKNGFFPFAVFLPIDENGPWQLSAGQMEATLATLDHVIRQHRIDPARIYLTGHSAGASGLWRLAEGYPHKWAAAVPVASFTDPDVQRVRHLPAWIFHGENDHSAPVERERALVRRLKDAGAEVRYTEIRKQGHIIWRDVYNRKELYDWIAEKRRP